MNNLFNENAQNCAHLAEQAATEADRDLYRRMEASWRLLETNEDWLEGRIPPDGTMSIRRETLSQRERRRLVSLPDA